MNSNAIYGDSKQNNIPSIIKKKKLYKLMNVFSYNMFKAIWNVKNIDNLFNYVYPCLMNKTTCSVNIQSTS